MGIWETKQEVIGGTKDWEQSFEAYVVKEKKNSRTGIDLYYS